MHFVEDDSSITRYSLLRVYTGWEPPMWLQVYGSYRLGFDDACAVVSVTEIFTDSPVSRASCPKS